MTEAARFGLYLSEYDLNIQFFLYPGAYLSITKNTGLVPGYLPGYDRNNQVWYTVTYPSMTKTTRFWYPGTYPSIT